MFSRDGAAVPSVKTKSTDGSSVTRCESGHTNDVDDI